MSALANRQSATEDASQNVSAQESAKQGKAEVSEKTAARQNSLANLRPWQPGQSGNPGGRPKGLASKAREATEDGQSSVDFYKDVAAGKLGASLKERMDAHAWLADRGYGKATTITELSGPEGSAISIDDVSEATRRFQETVARTIPHSSTESTE